MLEIKPEIKYTTPFSAVSNPFTAKGSIKKTRQQPTNKSNADNAPIQFTL